MWNQILANSNSPKMSFLTIARFTSKQNLLKLCLSTFFCSNAQFHCNKIWANDQKMCSKAKNNAQKWIEQMKWTKLTFPFFDNGKTLVQWEIWKVLFFDKTLFLFFNKIPLLDFYSDYVDHVNWFYGSICKSDHFRTFHIILRLLIDWMKLDWIIK